MQFYIERKKMPSWKETERYAFIALIVYFVFRFVSLYLTTNLTRITNIDPRGETYLVLLGGIPMLCNVGFGHWLSALNKGRGYMRTIWFIFGFFFGLTGVGLYYILRLCEHVKNKESNSVQQVV